VQESAQGGAAPLSIAAGVFWALFTAAIWSAWPAFTRLSVTRTITPEDNGDVALCDRRASLAADSIK